VVNFFRCHINPSQLATGLILVPFFMPGLVVGYAYRNASLSLVQTPILNELLYLAIVVAQLLPVAVLALEWLPPAALGPSATFCLRLANRSRQRLSVVDRVFYVLKNRTDGRAENVPHWGGWRERLAGTLPRNVTAGAIAALLCFQEVEVATLMQARGWAEWIFTKQAGGVELVDVWRWLVLPVAYGMVLTVPVLWYWTWNRLPSRHSPSHMTTGRKQIPKTHSRRNSGRLSAFLIVTSAWLLTVIWPVTSLTIGAIRGAGVLHLRSAIWQEIGDALVLAVTVTSLLAAICWGIGKWQSALPSRSSSPDPWSRRSVWLLAAISLLPGLLGSLALGLLIFEICQHIGVQPSYSPVPLVGGMMLFLLPRAIAMQAMLRLGEARTGVFLAERLAQMAAPRGGWGANILWKLRGAGRFWTLALLFWWSYLELTLPSLLRPAGMAPAPMRLYNFLHYGHIPGLAAMLVLVMSLPLVLLAIGHEWLARWYRPPSHPMTGR